MPSEALGAIEASGQMGLGFAELGTNIVTSALNVHESRQERRFRRDMSNTAHRDIFFLLYPRPGLGGSSTKINVNPVQQTAATEAGSPQGNLAAYATATY